MKTTLNKIRKFSPCEDAVRGAQSKKLIEITDGDL